MGLFCIFGVLSGPNPCPCVHPGCRAQAVKVELFETSPKRREPVLNALARLFGAFFLGLRKTFCQGAFPQTSEIRDNVALWGLFVRYRLLNTSLPGVPTASDAEVVRSFACF